MSFFDVFNLSFVVYLGILILCLSLLFVYFESKLREQNHKMASILQIVSTLAQEVHSAPPPPAHSSIEPHTFDDVKKVNASLELIDVSDGEDDDEEGYEEEEEEEGEEEEEEEEAEMEDLDESESESESDFEQDVSVLAEKLEIVSEEIDNKPELKREDPVVVVKLASSSEPELEEFNISSSSDLIPSDDFKAEFDDFHVIDGDDDAHSISSDFGEKQDEIKSEDLKSIILSANISVHDGADEGSVVGDEFTKDFKKMSQNKLKKLAIEKGLIQENSKLKKPELISLLERSL